MPIKRALVILIIAALLMAAIVSIATVLATAAFREKQSALGNYRVVDVVNGILFVMIFIYGIGFIVGAVYLFYHLKLREPILQITYGTAQIAHENLDFTIDYAADDELGQLCTSFEKMRSELRRNNAKMWRATEERKKLNAVFAHDLRTPLTVLKGYTDFLQEYIPSEQMQPDKLLQTTGKMAVHIERIQHYVSMMAEIQRVEDTPVTPKPLVGKDANDLLRGTVNMLEKKEGLSISFQTALEQESFNLDVEILQRVLENLLSNAVRYAKNAITVAVCCQGDLLILSVVDDGAGFPQEYLDAPFTPFYQGDGYLGLGLNICRTLCRNHDGDITIGNAAKGGAKVSASFKIR